MEDYRVCIDLGTIAHRQTQQAGVQKPECSFIYWPWLSICLAYVQIITWSFYPNEFSSRLVLLLPVVRNEHVETADLCSVMCIIFYLTLNLNPQ